MGRFRLTGRLGSGGQGVVFLGEDGSGARFAVKVPHPQSLANPETRARFARELDIARRTAPAFTARVVEAELEGAQPYIVSEYVEGPSLRERVEQGGPLEPDAVHRLATGLASALSAIHQAGIVHRDIKPDNVLLGPDGPRLIDFGIARLPGGTLTSSGHLLGTPLYMAPEVFEGERVSAAADVFAWGAVVAFAAQGSHAFGGGEVAAVMRRILSEEPDLGGVPKSIRPIVVAALAKQPAARPSAVDLMVRLVGGPSPGRDTHDVREGGKRRATRVTLAAVTAAALAAAGLTVYLVRPVDPSSGPQAGGPRGTTSVTDSVTTPPAVPEKGDTTKTDIGAEIVAEPHTTSNAHVPPPLKTTDVEAYYEVSPDEHAKKVKSLTARGFRPVSLSLTKQGYTALWRKQSGPAFVTAHDMSTDEYRRFWKTWSAKGYQETVAAAYRLGPVFASVMEKRGGRHRSYFGLTADKLRAHNAQARADGLIPTWITAYGDRFNVAWVQNTEAVDWTVTVNQTRAQFNKEFNKRWDEGYIPQVAGVGSNGLFTAMWRPWQGPVFSYTGLTAKRHLVRRKELLTQGYRLARLTATQVGDAVRYSLLAFKED